MINNFDELLNAAIERGPKKIAVACAEDIEILKAIKDANDKKIVEPILIGNLEKIKEISKNIGLDISNFETYNFETMEESAEKAVRLVSEGSADMVMKGLIDTAKILKAVLNKEYGLRTGNVLSHVAVFDVKSYHKLLFVTDAAMNIAPDLEQKKQIIENSLQVVKAVDIDTPKVAVICAKEKVNEKMICTVDAGKLVEMNESGEIKNCIVGGPFALDNAVSKEAAIVKGIDHPVAGDTDVLLCPNIESGNVLYKALNFLCDAKSAGIIVGASAPIVLVSRADSKDAKLNSIALGTLMAANK
ncbi:MAG: phosphate butyryltransferase [Bacillota bacterium]|nr:phosphate butyryltransferase [Bacillota bacterium]